MKYRPFHKDSICNNCLGCNRLEQSGFNGIISNPNKDNLDLCKNFKQCYSDEEQFEILKEQYSYGSLYGNND